MPDPAVRPELFAGLLRRRIAAYLVDALCIGAIMAAVWLVFLLVTLLSLGRFTPSVWFLFGLVPLAYHTLLVGGPHAATFGMRAFNLTLRSVNGERPGLLQALAHAALFYLTVGMTCSLILLVALFNRRKRTVHDFLAGAVMIRADAVG